MIHELKTWVAYFEDVLSNKKCFEVRLNDRDFHEGDYLILAEYDNVKKEKTGRECYRKVTYVLHGGVFGIEAGFVVLGIAMVCMEEIYEIEIELKKGLKSI